MTLAPVLPVDSSASGCLGLGPLVGPGMVASPLPTCSGQSTNKQTVLQVVMCKRRLSCCVHFYLPETVDCSFSGGAATCRRGDLPSNAALQPGMQPAASSQVVSGAARLQIAAVAIRVLVCLALVEARGVQVGFFKSSQASSQVNGPEICQVRAEFSKVIKSSYQIKPA